jgi:hypothetical protein
MGDIKGGSDRQRRFDDDGWLDEEYHPPIGRVNVTVTTKHYGKIK